MHRTILVSILALLLTGAVALESNAERVRWRFEMESVFSGDEVAVGQDGTIYASDNTKLYALASDGTVKWTRTGVGGGTPVSFLSDGTIIVGLGETVYALDPADGADVWTYSYDSNGFREQIEVGPSVGPDGNIYGVTSTDGEFGLGAFSLTPSGQLRWNDEGEPRLDPINAGTGGPVYFTSERLIFPFNTVANGSSLIFGYDFDGDQTLFVDFTCTGPPRTDPLDRLLITSSCGIEALEQDGNASYWTVPLGPIPLAPAIGTDATAYSGVWAGNLSAIDPDGTISWTSSEAGSAERMLAVRDDVGVLVYSGGDFGVPSFVAGVDTNDGSLLWTVDLMTVSGSNELMWTSRAATSLDGSTVYFTTRFTSNGAPGALYAVRIVDDLVDVDAAGVTPETREVMALRVRPNPFVGSHATISFETLEAGAVSVRVYAATGSLVETVLDEVPYVAGEHRITPRLDAAPGVYFVHVESRGIEGVRKVVRMR